MKRKVIISSIVFCIIVSISLFIRNAFFKPTVINSFIAAKIYTAPANTSFTNDSFYQCVINAYNNGKTNAEKVNYTHKLSESQLSTIEVLDCSYNDYNNSDITGIELLTSLTELDLAHNQIEFINLSLFPNLVTLDLSDNKLLTLDTTQNLNLEEVNVEYNEIYDVELNNANLLSLNISNNKLSEIDVTSVNNLKSLKIEHNDISEITLFSLTKLETLYAAHNKLTDIDISNNTELINLQLGNTSSDYPEESNKFDSLDVSNNTKLKYICADDLGINSIDLQYNPLLTEVHLEKNNLETIDFKNNPNIYRLHLSDNKLKSVNVSAISKLKNFHIENNELTELNITNNEALVFLLANNNNLDTINVSNNSSLETLSLLYNSLNTLDLSNNLNLKYLYLNPTIGEIKRNYEINQGYNINTSRDIDAFSEYLENLLSLKTLDLSKNVNITDISASFFQKDIIYWTDYELPEFSSSASTYITFPIKYSSSSGSSPHTILNGEEFQDEIPLNLMYADGHSSVDNISLNVNHVYHYHLANLTSDSYYIDNEDFLIDILDEKIDENILTKISINYGNLKIDGNKLIIYDDNDEIVKEFDIVTSYKEKININDFKITNNINNENKWFAGYKGNISFDLTSEDIQDFSNLNLKVLKDEKEITEFYITKSQENNILSINISILESTDPNIFETGNYIISIYNNDSLLSSKEFEINEPIKITDIELEDIIINYRDSDIIIEYNVLPIDSTNKNVTYEITDSSVAELDIYNKISPKNIGKTTLTLTTQDGSNIEKQVNLEVVDFNFSQNQYKVDYVNKTIRRIGTEETYEKFFNNFSKFNSADLKSYSGDTLLSNSDILKTANEMAVQVGEKTDKFSIIVDGDLNGDGKVLANDIIISKLHILERNNLSGIKLQSGDINLDGQVNATDIMFMKMFILEKYKNVWGN